MGALKIKRKIIQHERQTEKLLRARVASVSVVQDATTGAILSIGVDHASAVANVPEGRQGWEVREYRIWR